MATKTILKDTKAPLLFFRSPLSAASVPKTTSPNPQLIQTILSSNQKPLLHLSGLRQYFYQQPPSAKFDRLELGGALDSTLGRLQVRGSSDDEEENVGTAEWDDDDEDEDYGDFDSDAEHACDEENTDSDE